LVTGYRPVEDILETSRSLIHPDARALLSALCPKRSAYVWPFDRF